MNKTQEFNPNAVIEYYKKEEFKKIPTDKLIDEIPTIHRYDLDALETWKKHFQSVGRPYAVTEGKKERLIWGKIGYEPVYTLFKEDVIGK